MKLLKTSLLLAAAATATQSSAETFNFTYSDTSGNAAHGSVTADALSNGIYWANSGNLTVTASTNASFIGTHALTPIPDTGPGGTTFFPAGSGYFWDNKIYPAAEAIAQTYGRVYNGIVFGNVGVWTVDDNGAIVGVFSTWDSGTNTWSDAPYGTLTIGMGSVGVVDFVDWLSSVNNQNRVYAAGTTLASLPLEGAHHRPMMSFDRMGKDAQFWATGDFGSSSRVRDVKVTSGEVGVNKDIGPNTLAGFAIGRGQQNQDLALDGSNNVIGNYVLGEIDYRPFGSQWIVSLLGMVGSWDAKINRGYSNSGSTDYSLGQTDIISRSARLRVDAPVLFSVAGFGFSPYASYAVTQTVVEAYTEAGGALPASYDEQKHNATEARLGMMATKVINEKLKLIVSVEGIHRFDGAGPALTGQDITGSVGFSLPGQAPRPDCVRLGVDVDYKLAADTLLNISAHASTVGEVADVSGAVSIRRAF